MVHGSIESHGAFSLAILLADRDSDGTLNEVCAILSKSPGLAVESGSHSKVRATTAIVEPRSYGGSLITPWA